MLPGIDVSHYQEEIDWFEVASQGIQFAYIKATEGANYVDPMFEQNWKGATEAGLICGAYHFLTDSDPVQQAKNFARIPSGGLPPAVDIELPSINSAFVLEFLQANPNQVLGTPMRAVVYVDAWLIGDLDDLFMFPLWLAEYDVPMPTALGTWGKWTFWQHSQTGSVEGISAPVDLDWFNGSLDALKSLLT